MVNGKIERLIRILRAEFFDGAFILSDSSLRLLNNGRITTAYPMRIVRNSSNIFAIKRFDVPTSEIIKDAKKYVSSGDMPKKKYEIFGPVSEERNAYFTFGNNSGFVFIKLLLWLVESTDRQPTVRTSDTMIKVKVKTVDDCEDVPVI